MAKNFYLESFATTGVLTYDQTKTTLQKRAYLTSASGFLTAPSPKAIPYLEQGNGVILPNCVYVSDTHIYVAGATAATTIRVNRFLRSNLAFDGFVTLNTDATGNKTAKDIIVTNGTAGASILVGFISATATGGGVAWAFGLTASDWTGGLSLTLGSTTFVAKTTYVIAQNATNTIQNLAAMCVSNPATLLNINNGTPSSCVLYILQTTNTALLPAFLRIDLGSTLTAPVGGRSTLTDAFRIGQSIIMTGDFSTSLPSVSNSQLIYATPGANHAAGIANVPALFYTRGTTTTSRIGRLTGVAFGSGITAETDYMPEIPPLGTSIQTMGGSMTALVYDGENDYFHAVTSTAVLPKRDYKTVYNPSAVMTQIYGPGGCVEGNPIANTNAVVWATHTNVKAGFMAGSGNAVPGMFVIARQAPGTTQGQQLLVMDPGADQCSAILPAVSTPNAIRFYDAYMNRKTVTANWGAVEPVAMYYRTAGIVDNSGAWTSLTGEADLSGVGPAAQIQFKIVFNLIGTTCIPTQIDSFLVTWEDNNTTDSHYEPSVDKSSVAGLVFAYRQGTAWSMTIPNMRMRIYNATTGLLQLDDNSASPAYGTWQYSTDGTNWNSWSTSADAVGNYIRYTATSLTAGITARALLTQA